MLINKRAFKKIENKLLFSFVIAVTLVKVVLGGAFSSDYQYKMFMPFVEHFICYGDNVYEYYYNNHMISAFPYPPLMLWIESLGGIIIHFLGINMIFIKNIVFKLPLYICDIILFYILCKMCRGKEKYVVVLYYCSPIILYSTYMHGQLDIIPTTFLIMAIYCLINNHNRNSLFSICLIAALATKFHIIAIVPLLYIYKLRKQGLKSIWGSIIAVLIGVTLIVMPFWGEGFINNVLFNKEQEVLTQVFLDYGSVKIYIAILAIALLYLKVIQLNYINKELLLCLGGMIFSAFLICIPPMPGWFVWIVPFSLFYFVEVQENRYKNVFLYAVLCILYLIYFVFFHKTDYVSLYFFKTSLEELKINNEVLVNICFTGMAGALMTVIYSMYAFGIKKNSLYRRANKSFTIGIAGDSGSGKSEMYEMLEKLLTSQKVLLIEGDGDHRWERGDKNWEVYTHLNPKANYLYRQTRDLKALKNGNTVQRGEYNHLSGKFDEKHRVVSKPYIVICGLHSLYLPQMRDVLDLKIYMDTDEKLRRYWKIQRDVHQRGYDKNRILEQIEKRISDAERYIYPQRECADLVYTYFDMTLEDGEEEKHNMDLSIKIQANIAMDFGELLDELEDAGLNFSHRFEEGLKFQSITFNGTDIKNAELNFDSIAQNSIVQFDDLFSDVAISKDMTVGLIQIFALYAISLKMKGNV